MKLMKKALWILVILALCCSESLGETTGPVSDAVASGLAVQATGLRQAAEEMFSLGGIDMVLSVTDGELYGCDIVCWFDGFGFCYNVENTGDEAWAIGLSEEVPFEGDSAGYIKCGYRLYLTSETSTYRIGFLRILERPHIWGYGTFFDIMAWEDPEAELLPAEPQAEVVERWEEGGWFEPGMEEETVLVHPERFRFGDSNYEPVDGSEGEAYSIGIAEDINAGICFFDCERNDMVVTKERFLQLARDGYFMDYPCWTSFSEGRLTLARQLPFY